MLCTLARRRPIGGSGDLPNPGARREMAAGEIMSTDDTDPLAGQEAQDLLCAQLSWAPGAELS